MKLETRKLFQLIPGTGGGITGVHSAQTGGRWVDQIAIPWCTTHDRWTEGFGFCRANDIPNEICEVSTGGPDHKWWEDA